MALRAGEVLETCVAREAATVVDWCRQLGAVAVGIDAPCKWSVTGRARLCEWELARSGMTAFATPSAEVGRQHPFYGWMLNGAELFRLLAPRYRLYDGKLTNGQPVSFETFPHAVACALAHKVLLAKRKRLDRPRLLRKAGLPIQSLPTIDLIDAALCALTARHVLVGHVTTYGDKAEGFIVVPRS